MNDMNPTGGLVTRCLLNQRVFRHYRSIYWPQQVLLDKIARNANLKSLSQLSILHTANVIPTLTFTYKLFGAFFQNCIFRCFTTTGVFIGSISGTVCTLTDTIDVSGRITSCNATISASSNCKSA